MLNVTKDQIHFNSTLEQLKVNDAVRILLCIPHFNSTLEQLKALVAPACRDTWRYFNSTLEQLKEGGISQGGVYFLRKLFEGLA
jgi:hypothetical protein